MTLHGDTGTNLYNIWHGMFVRCRKNYFQRKYYYDKNIKICKSWHKYVNFKNWAMGNGYKKGLTIDRRDNSKGYNPNNCRFVTQQKNNFNKCNNFYIVYKKKKVILKELLIKWHREKEYYAIYHRIKRGWCVATALRVPVRK